jgi:putative component of membrane protein insertase Oxa1/YidC/SpoIIIJ protein YidD
MEWGQAGVASCRQQETCSRWTEQRLSDYSKACTASNILKRVRSDEPRCGWQVLTHKKN